MPLVNLRLQLVTNLQQLPIDRGQLINDSLKAAPECRGLEFDLN